MGQINYDAILARSSRLNANDIIVLFFIYDNRGVSMSQVSAELGIDNIDLSYSIKALNQEGLIMNRSGNLIPMI